ncbi:single-stranded-DNA-specific exonuclease RecJ [Paenibacillus senegalensis]|uniref:single-stranded-DNA-specific exonuclease RecJ n=1 Tax=Paenibacillus senegalensis TaxID=1465766 RepID=UPI000287C1AC|nr:single-stranded-DNA-specific exonuclease RecJ [Paenibacillus senegalensis]
MLAPKARWIIHETRKQHIEALTSQLGISPLLAGLLVARGLTDAQDAERFLNAGIAHLENPFLMDGMELAVQRIRQALDRGQKIRIYGDYDADGISSTSLMIALMKRLEANFDYYIPHRVREGYGLNRDALDHAVTNGVELLITVDTGISAYPEIEYANSIGLDTIITDHHEPPEVLPPALAILNPKKPGCPYPCKHLAGVGVAFKLAQALLGGCPEELLEFVALGTIADLMPLTGENRPLVKLGLERLRSTANRGFLALMDASGVKKEEVSSGHVGFSLAPRINASGRLESADLAVRLLTTEDPDEARELALHLDILNKERQAIVETITTEAITQVQADKEAEAGLARVLIAAEADWNVGVIGIVASKLLETYYRPAFVFGIDPQTGIAKGSARSIPGFDLYKALTECSDLLDHYGGHQGAAGMSLHREKLPELKSRLLSLANEWLQERDLIPVVEADIVCGLEEATLESIAQLDRLAPFGAGNPSPKVILEKLVLADKKLMGRDKQHLKLTLGADPAAAMPRNIEAIGFGQSRLYDWMASGAKVDVLGELSINEWNGSRKPQLILRDVRITEPQFFDWRGMGHRMIKELQTVCSPVEDAPPIRDAAAGVLVFSDQEAEELPDYLRQSSSIWQVTSAGQLLAIHNPASEEFAQVTDLIIWTLPPQPQRLEQALKQAHRTQRIYAVWDGTKNDGPIFSTLPGREKFKQVYGAMVQQNKDALEKDAFVHYVARKSGLPPSSIQFIMKVFEELSFVELDGTGYRCVPSPPKRELSESPSYRMQLEYKLAEDLFLYSSVKELSHWIISRLPVRLN